MRKGIRVSFWMAVIWLGNIWSVTAQKLPDELQNLYAHSAVVTDGSSGRVLFGKNETECMPMASTTKIMTCIVALEESGLQEQVTVSQYAASQPEVRLGASVGEQFYLEDLLYALMLESYNDAAVMVAEEVSGSVEAFTAKMNEKAAELGCTHTHFVTPNGLDGVDDVGAHETTAEELARIMQYCVWESPEAAEFLKITQTKSYTFSNLQGSRSYSCTNHNAFLDRYEGVLSGKTGFTSAAGYCYVCAVESEGRKFAGVVLACGWPYNRTYKWQDMSAMMDYAKAHYRNVELTYPEKDYPVDVKNGWNKKQDPWEKVQIFLQEVHISKKVLIGDQEKIVRHIEYKKTKEAPIKKKEVLGKIQFFLGNELIQETKLTAAEHVEKKTLQNCLVWIVEKICL